MSRQVQVTFDAHDPRAQSRFWADALDGLYIHEDAFPSYRLTRN